MRVSKGGNVKTAPTLRDASLRDAPQGEVDFCIYEDMTRHWSGAPLRQAAAIGTPRIVVENHSRSSWRNCSRT